MSDCLLVTVRFYDEGYGYAVECFNDNEEHECPEPWRVMIPPTLNPHNEVPALPSVAVADTEGL